jgi:Rieske Fe-S protein
LVGDSTRGRQKADRQQEQDRNLQERREGREHSLESGLVNTLPDSPSSSSQASKSSGTKTTRRGFLGYLLGGSIVGLVAWIVYPIIRYVLPPPQPEAAENQVIAAKVGDLALNSGKIFKFGSKPALLVLTQAGEYRAFSATCTHLDCTVQYRPDYHHIWCACHNGQYDLTGKNISGPPPRPLEVYEVLVQGEDIIVRKNA